MVLIGIDPHKATHTAVVIDDAEHELARVKVKADKSQVAALLDFADVLSPAAVGDRVRRRAGVPARPAARPCR